MTQKGPLESFCVHIIIRARFQKSARNEHRNLPQPEQVGVQPSFQNPESAYTEISHEQPAHITMRTYVQNGLFVFIIIKAARIEQPIWHNPMETALLYKGASDWPRTNPNIEHKCRPNTEQKQAI